LYKKEPKKLLKQAISINDYDFVQEILNNSYFDINGVDESYHTILDYACTYGRVSIMRLLISHKARLGILFYEIDDEQDFTEKVYDLYHAGYNLNHLDKLGFAPIHYATSMGFSNGIKKLMDLGAKVLQNSINGKVSFYSNNKKPTLGVFIGQA